MNKFLFFVVVFHVPFLLAIDEKYTGTKRDRAEASDLEVPPVKKTAGFPLHQACLNGSYSEVEEIFSSGLLDVKELNNEGLSPMQCLEASYKEFIDTNMGLLFTNSCSQNLENEENFFKIAAALIMKGADLPIENFLLDGLKEYFKGHIEGFIRNAQDESSEPGMFSGFERIIKTGLIDLTATANRILDTWIIDERNFVPDINFPLALSVLEHHGASLGYRKYLFYVFLTHNYKELLGASLANNDQKGSDRLMTVVKVLKGYREAQSYKNFLHNLFGILVKSGNPNAIIYVEKLIELGLDIDNPDPVECTSALLVSLLEKNFAIARLLLKEGANIERKNAENLVSIRGARISPGSSLVHTFVSTRLIEVVEFLIDNGANIAAIDNEGNTPLHTLCQTSDAPDYPDNVKEQELKIMTLLLGKGADPNIKNNDGHTPIMLALSIEMVQLLLSDGAIIEKPITNIPSIFRAGIRNNLELLKFWGEQGANLASQTTQPNGRTLFLDLFSNNRTIAMEILEYLYGLGADINALDKQGESALMCACRRGRGVLVKWLIEHNANLDHSRLNRGKSETALSIACSTYLESGRPHQAIVDLLLVSGCTVTSDLNNNYYIKEKLKQKSALHEAVVGGDLEALQQLIAEGGDLWIDVKTDAGEFLLDIADRLDDKSIYNLLISKSKKKIPTKTTKSARKT